MRIEIAPILATLGRHRLTVWLIVLQVAVTCAIVCNALFLVSDRWQWMHAPSGIDEDRIVTVDVSDMARSPDVHARVMANLAALRALPSVEAVTVTNSVPFGPRSWNTEVGMSPEHGQGIRDVSVYYGEGVAEILGARLAEGRYIRHDEYLWIDDRESMDSGGISVVVITRALARRLVPEGSALGRVVYVGSHAYRIVGVLERLPGAAAHRATAEQSILMPWRMLPAYGAGYLIRARPGLAGQAVREASAAIEGNGMQQVVEGAQTYSEIRSHFFARDRAMTGVLVSVCMAMLTITALGVVGLASFWVGQRRRQIGVRRALGATRQDIRLYFQTENFVLSAMGIAAGVVLALAINRVMMRLYETPALPLGYLPLAAVLLWLLGQAAVLAPARRAAAVSPMEATRG